MVITYCVKYGEKQVITFIKLTISLAVNKLSELI